MRGFILRRKMRCTLLGVTTVGIFRRGGLVADPKTGTPIITIPNTRLIIPILVSRQGYTDER